MSEKPEALRLAKNLLNEWWGLTASTTGLPVIDPIMVTALRVSAAQMLRVLHADNERLTAEIERLRSLLTEARPFVLSSQDPVGNLVDDIDAALRREET